MNTRSHTHWCPKCERAVDCPAAHDGGCIFASSSPVTCQECEEAAWPLEGAGTVEPQVELFGATTPAPPQETT